MLLEELFSGNTIIKYIYLKNKKDKKIKIKRLIRKKNLNILFNTVTLHENPQKGCLESHCNLIEQYHNKKDYILILEDDVHFIRNIPYNIELPSEWDMLYFGGTVKVSSNKYNDNWTRVSTWSTHSYIVNLTNSKLVEKILDARNQEYAIDNYYINHIHSKFLCYMITPMVAIQRDGYSDIEKKDMSYDFMKKTLEGLNKPESENKDGECRLILPDLSDDDLPTVSIITPTYNRRNFFSLPIYCFLNFNYPKEKIEWIIVEEECDKDEERDTVEDMVKFDKRIKYKKIKKEDGNPICMGLKRNICVENCSNQIIIHMDDDDYYPPESILARVKILVKYKGNIGLVGSSTVGIYNIHNNKSSFISDGNISISEASMGYWRSFWEEQNFMDTDSIYEYRGIMSNRLDKIMDIPYFFIIFVLSHKNNYKNNYRINNLELFNNLKSNKSISMYWDDETNDFINIILNNI